MSRTHAPTVVFTHSRGGYEKYTQRSSSGWHAQYAEWSGGVVRLTGAIIGRPRGSVLDPDGGPTRQAGKPWAVDTLSVPDLLWRGLPYLVPVQGASTCWGPRSPYPYQWTELF
ncbi:hypothetical protein J6590_013976 [Homalodisca vitripennis]|nr:hypothetical protein J6590_013976 [Homalodisca vitripennis]